MYQKTTVRTVKYESYFNNAVLKKSCGLLGGNIYVGNILAVGVHRKFWEVWGTLSGYWQKIEQPGSPEASQGHTKRSRQALMLVLLPPTLTTATDFCRSPRSVGQEHLIGQFQVMPAAKIRERECSCTPLASQPWGSEPSLLPISAQGRSAPKQKILPIQERQKLAHVHYSTRQKTIASERAANKNYSKLITMATE